MRERKKRGIEAGILLAVTVCMVCGAEKMSRAALNAAVTNVSVSGTISQETFVYVIVLPEHKNKTPNRVSGHKYSTCHFGQV